MDFSLSEEQLAVRDLAREVLGAAADRAGRDRPAAPSSTGAGIDRRAWSQAARAGLLGVGLPEDAGGSGGGIVEVCVLLEEVGRAGVPLPLYPTLALGALPVARFAAGERLARYLRPVVAGQAVLTAALPDTVLDHPGSTPVAAGSDGRLTGAVPFVPSADAARWILVPARTGRGVTVFVVDADSEGVELTPQPEPGGLPLSRLGLANAPAEPLAEGAESVLWMAERAAVALCALQLGLAEEALRITARYTTGREQFGRPLATFQAVQQRAADAYIDVETMRVTMWRAAWRLGQGLPGADEVAVAKLFGAEAGHRVMATAQHLHGGIGVDVDYPLHRYVLWSKQVELALGGATAHLARLGTSLAGTAEEACARVGPGGVVAPETGISPGWSPEAGS